MIRQLLAFEISYQRKQWALFLGSLLFFLTGIQIGSQAFAPDLLNYNAPYQISYYLSLFTLGSVFAIMFFTISGVLREQDYDSESLLYSSGIKKYHFFVSRFLGVFIFSLISISPLVLGMIVGTHLFDLDSARLSLFSIYPYLWNWFVFIVPNVFICTSIIFSISLFTKNRLAVYASAVFIYAGYFITASIFGSPIFAGSNPSSFNHFVYASIADPFGISAFIEQSQYWTPIQKNTLNVSLSGNFLLNRILWILTSLVLLVFTYLRFSFTTSHKASKKKKNQEKTSVTPTLIYTPVNYQTGTFKSFWSSYIFQLKMGIKQMLKSLPFWAIVLIWVVICTSEIFIFLYEAGSYSEKLYPLTHLLVGVYEQPLFILSLLLVVFYSGEWVWKERSVKFNYIVDATPVSNASVFLSKISVLVVIPLVLTFSGILISIVFQIIGGFTSIDWGVYLSTFYFYGFKLLFFILLSVFFQSLLPYKYLGMLITGVLALGLSSSLSISLGIEHPLLRIGAIPLVHYTGMTGLGNYSTPFHIFSWHWFNLGLVLLLFSFKLWQKGIEVGFIENVKKIGKHWTYFEKVSLLISLLLFLGSSGLIFYKTNIESEYLSNSKQLDVRADYEKRYKSFENLDRLFPAFIKTEMDIYPDKQEYEVNAVYLLVNKHQKAIDTVLITPRGNLTSLSFNRGQLIEHNTIHNTYLFKFNNGIVPGDTVSLEFSVKKEKNDLEADRDIVNNGTYIHLRDFSPITGYRSALEIRSNVERRKRELPDRKPEIISEADLTTEEISFGKIHVETFISTHQNQTAISVGNLVEQWNKNGRNYYHFKTSTPVSPAIGYFSARYQIETETYSGIKLEHYFHPEHTYNTNLIMQSMKSTLQYAEEAFGEYPFDHLRIAEIPAHFGFGGYAHPGTISMVEDKLYLVDERDSSDFSLVAKRTIHEVAHQWWGHKLSPVNTSGGSIFVEGFAKYTEAIIMEKMYGKISIFQLSESANQRYFTGRSYAQTPEQPLYLEQGEGYLLYGKSYTIMLALKELIGEDNLNDVLKTLVERHKDELDPTLTSLEFINELYKVTPPEYHSLIDDWFKKIVTYSLKVNNVTYSKKDNSFIVELHIEASKFEHKNGLSEPVTLEEPIQIGLFSDHPSQAYDEDIIYLESHKVKNGTSIIILTVDALPKYVAIDPYGTRLDLVRNNNWIKVE